MNLLAKVLTHPLRALRVAVPQLLPGFVKRSRDLAGGGGHARDTPHVPGRDRAQRPTPWGADARTRRGADRADSAADRYAGGAAGWLTHTAG
jgi:hypothetical protein